MPASTLRVLEIIDGTIVDGTGLRTSIYLAGCRHSCPGCHNPQSWDFSSGRDVLISDIIEHIVRNDMNVTLSGGDPLYQIDGVVELCKRVHLLGKSIWIYTGFTYEDIYADESLSAVLKVADVIVDGPFILARRDTTLRFRGSSNQRIIDLKKSDGPEPFIWSDEV